MQRAHDLFALTFDEPIAPKVNLDVIDAPDFGASVALRGHTVTLSTGIADRLEALWSALLETSILTSADGSQRIAACSALGHDAAAYSDLSLTWLCLHELMHVHLDHGMFLDDAHLVEIGMPQVATSAIFDGVNMTLGSNETPYLRPCLEMQADGDATDIFIGLYDSSRWEDIRLHAAAVFTVMTVIEQENLARGNRHLSHPSAGTRFFALMAHLFQMWSYPGAHLEDTDQGLMVRKSKALEPEDFDAYARGVLSPVVDDAVLVATAAQAESFLRDIGGPGALFHDIFKIQYAENLSPAILDTDAAKDWLRLMPVNLKLHALAGRKL